MKPALALVAIVFVGAMLSFAFRDPLLPKVRTVFVIYSLIIAACGLLLWSLE